jgi:hypothetical protein
MMKENEQELPVTGGMSALSEAAVTFHELYVAFRDAGFSQDEALTLVTNIMMESRNATSNDE